MILIDADTVATRIEEMPCYYDECIDTIEAIVEMIKYDIPPVKAIPIEYIEKFKKEFRAVASVKAVIEWLLENWEKENANNN